MNNAQIEQLMRIFNTLNLVTTKGEDTIIMAQCLNALRDFIAEIQQVPQQVSEV